MIWQVLVTETTDPYKAPERVASVTQIDGQVIIGIYDYDENLDSFQGKKITDFGFDAKELMAMLVQLNELDNDEKDD